jgi:hypothetical protein
VDIPAILKGVAAAIGRCMNRYTPMQFLAVGGLIVITALLAWDKYHIVHMPNGKGNDVLLAKLNLLGNQGYGELAIIGIGIIGLFMLAKAFGGVRGSFAGNSFEVSAPDQPLSLEQQPCNPPFVPPCGPQPLGGAEGPTIAP